MGAVFGLGGGKDENLLSGESEDIRQTTTSTSPTTIEDANAIRPSTEGQIEVDAAYKKSPALAADHPSEAEKLATQSGEAGGKPITSPRSGDSKVKTWLKSHFRRSTNPDTENDADKSFVGGAALGGSATVAKSTTSTSEGKPEEDSMREVALAGKSEPEDMYGASEDEEAERDVSPPHEPPEMARQQSPSISSLSSSNEEADVANLVEEMAPPERERGRLGFRERLKGLGKTNRKTSKDNSRTSNKNEDTSEDDKQDEEFEEARDTFDEGPALAPPPKLTQVVGAASSKGSGSPARDSRFSEEF